MLINSCKMVKNHTASQLYPIFVAPMDIKKEAHNRKVRTIISIVCAAFSAVLLYLMIKH